MLFTPPIILLPASPVPTPVAWTAKPSYLHTPPLATPTFWYVDAIVEFRTFCVPRIQLHLQNLSTARGLC